MNRLPHFRGIKQVIKQDQNTHDIMNEVYKAHFVFLKDYDAMLDYFSAEDPVQLAKQVFKFCKDNIAYRIESENFQTTRSPAGILYLKAGDCKHYAGLVAGILDAVRRSGKMKFDLAYRFASYELLDSVPAHVFVVMKYKGQDYWIDPVLKNFDQRKPAPTFSTDKKIPMALVRLSGLTQPQNYPKKRVGAFYDNIATTVSTQTGGNAYDQKAAMINTAFNLATSSIPFVSLAQGLASKFFGAGGISDWLSPAGIINELQAAVFGRMYRGGQYWLGEKFKYYVMGENIHTRDADVVGDQTVGTAITVLSVGFGVPVEDYQDIINLGKSAQDYINRYVQLGADLKQINVNAVARAVQLRKMYFPTETEGNFSATGVAPQKWDLNNFNKINYAAPIPNFTAPYSAMWAGTYSGKIPDGEVREGIVINGPLSTAAANLPGAPLSNSKLILIAGAVLVAGYFLIKKRRQ